MRNSCRVCAQPFLPQPLLRYENMPSVAQNFPDATTVKNDHGVDLNVMQCSGCGLVQLNSEPVPYFRDVIRAAGYSPEMGAFRREQFAAFLERYGLKGKKIFEAGCGRGEYASLMQECGGEVYGFEHLDASVAECVKNGLRVTKGFVESRDAKIPDAPFDAFLVLNFLEHIPDIRSFLGGISANLAEGGLGLVEVPNFDMILRDQMFCEFMTDHLYYFKKETLCTVLCLNGFEVLECHEVWHSYILSAVVRKKARTELGSFDQHQKKLQAEIGDFLLRFPANSVAVWGAGHAALAVLALAKLGGQIRCVIDSAPFKQNKFTPATHIPILPPATLESDPAIHAVIVMGASYSDEIARTLRDKYRKNISVAILRAHGLEAV